MTLVIAHLIEPDDSDRDHDMTPPIPSSSCSGAISTPDLSLVTMRRDKAIRVKARVRVG